MIGNFYTYNLIPNMTKTNLQNNPLYREVKKERFLKIARVVSKNNFCVLNILFQSIPLFKKIHLAKLAPPPTPNC